MKHAWDLFKLSPINPSQILASNIRLQIPDQVFYLCPSLTGGVLPFGAIFIDSISRMFPRFNN